MLRGRQGIAAGRRGDRTLPVGVRMVAGHMFTGEYSAV